MTEPIDRPLTNEEVSAYAAEPETKPLPEAPYRGVEAFRFIDQQLFVARETETWNLLSSVMIYRGVLLYGGSGTGKSSMINAGLIPSALKENFMPNILRVQPWRDREIKIERIPIEHDGKPPYLPSSFTQDESAASVECSIQDIHRTLKQLDRSQPPEKRPMLIFDQFEEFITLFEEAAHIRSGNGDDDLQTEAIEAQSSILRAVTDLIHDETLPLKIVFVFREDYLGKLSILFESSPDLLDQYLRLMPPRVEMLQKIIRAPFEKKELRDQFARQQRKSKGEELTKLADRIARELAAHGDGGVNLSELQIVCRKLWESDKPAALFNQPNPIQTLIEGYWSDALKKFPGELYEPAVALLGHMITSSGTRNIVSEDDLLTDEKKSFPEELLKRALEALVQSKLVRREPRYKLYFYEIVSEYLVPWIQRLKAARMEELERVETRENLSRAEAQNRQLRRWRQGLAAVCALLLLAGIGVAYLYRQSKANERAARDAEEAKKLEVTGKQKALDAVDVYAEVFSKLHKLTDPSADVRLTAIQEIGAMDQSRILPARKLLPTMILADTDKRVVDAGRSLLNNLAQAQSEQEQHADIQIEHQDNQDQKARADRIKLALTVKGVVVDDRYQYGGAPPTNQVRHCNIAAEGLQPERVAQILTEIDGNKWTATPIAGCGTSDKVRSNSYQISFASDTRSVFRDLVNIETQWKNAKIGGDVGTLQRIFASDFTNIDTDGTKYSKAEWINALRGGNPNFRGWRFETTPELLDYGGNTAILRFVITVAGTREIDIDVFVKRSGRWQVLSSQSTPLE